MRASILAVGMVLAAAPDAATDGLLSPTTSTATFSVSANGPVAQRQVQVLGATTLAVGSSGLSLGAAGAAADQATAFCVVDTHGGAVQLSIATGNPLDPSGNWVLKTRNGEAVPYRLRVSDLANSQYFGPTWGQGGAPAADAQIAAGLTVTSGAACGAGNLRAHVYADGALPERFGDGSYADILTLVVAPN
jgi:hypothetical protein